MQVGVSEKKNSDDGKTCKYKAILFEKGFSQVQGVEYHETFVPMAKMDSICLVLAISASKHWEVHHMDVESAFIHGDNNGEIYMNHNNGYISYPTLVCEFQKSLYGLKHAPRSWYAKMDAFLLSQNFQRRMSDLNVYLQKYDGHLIMIFLYVDDILITGSTLASISFIKIALHDAFEMRDLGLLKQFSRMEIS